MIVDVDKLLQVISDEMHEAERSYEPHEIQGIVRWAVSKVRSDEERERREQEVARALARVRQYSAENPEF